MSVLGITVAIFAYGVGIVVGYSIYAEVNGNKG